MTDDAGMGAAGSGAGGNVAAALVRPSSYTDCLGGFVDQYAFDAPEDAGALELGTLDDGQQSPTLGYTELEGSPSLGALSVDAIYEPNQAVKLSKTLRAPMPVACLSVRIKLVATAETLDVATPEHGAAWLLWAIDDASCYAEARNESHNWPYELTRAGVWYELSMTTDKFVSVGPHCLAPFNPKRVATVGLGLGASPFCPAHWHAALIADSLRLY